MKIAIQALLHRPKRGGVEKTIQAAVHGLMRASLPYEIEYFLSDSLEIPPTLTPGAPNAPGAALIHRTRYSSRLERILKEQALSMRRRDFALWHFLGYVMPSWPPRGCIVANVYDITALTHPRLCTPPNRLYYRFALPHTLRRADRIIVPSQCVAQRITERFPEAVPRIRIVALPLPPPFGCIAENDPPAPIAPHDASPRPQKKYLLYLGDFGPKKNLDFLLRAYARLPHAMRQEHPLHLCGARKGTPKGISSLIHRLGIAQDTHIQGYMDDAALPALYAGARLFLYPSLDEGYGYPPLEAMAMGTPAIVSDRGALPEVASAAGAVVSPLDEGAFAHAMMQMLQTPVLQNPAPHEIALHPDLSSLLRRTWTDYAQEIAGIYDELLA